MNIPLKQHLTIAQAARPLGVRANALRPHVAAGRVPAIKRFSATIGSSWFVKWITVDALLSRVRMLMQLEKEQFDEEPMPVALATLLQRVDELAAHEAGLEEHIRQIERECEWQSQGRNRELPSLDPWRPFGHRGNRPEKERRHECPVGK